MLSGRLGELDTTLKPGVDVTMLVSVSGHPVVDQVMFMRNLVELTTL